MKKHLRNDKGFSLVEMLIAIFILAIGLIGAASLMASGIGANRMADRMTIDSGIVHSVMDEFMARDAGDVVFNTNVVGIVYDLDSAGAGTTRIVRGVTYSAIYSITTGTPVTGMVKIDISVSGGGRTVSMTSFKRNI